MSWDWAKPGFPLRPNPLAPFPARGGGKIWRGWLVSLRVGPKTRANPKPTRVGNGGSRGGTAPMAGGRGGCAPFTPTEVSPFEKGRPAPSTGVASLRPYIEPGVEGAQPPPRGFGGCAPKNIKIRGELPTLATPPRVGPKTLANPKPTGAGKIVTPLQYWDAPRHATKSCSFDTRPFSGYN